MPTVTFSYIRTMYVPPSACTNNLTIYIYFIDHFCVQHLLGDINIIILECVTAFKHESCTVYMLQ